MTVAARRSMNSYYFAVAILLAMSMHFGCSDDSDDSVDTDTDTTTDTNPPEDAGPSPAEWVIEQIEDADVGLRSKIAVGPDGTVAVAYFANQAYDDGECTEIEIAPPTRLRQELRFAAKAPGATAWTAELVDSPVVTVAPNGLSLDFDAQGRANVAFTGGVPEMQYCGGHDAVLATKDATGWTMETAGALSGDSQTGEAASDSGNVVGLWPSLAFDPQGQPAILHKDAHFGSLQHDDKYRADAELAWRNGGGWSHEAVDYGEGAGDWNELIFDSEGRPVAFYAITVEAQGTSRHGVWAARRETDGTWNQVRLHAGAIHQEISAAIDPLSNDLLVAFYAASDYAVKLLRLAPEAEFADATAWTSEQVGDARYDEGQYVSLAFTPSGKAALAYHRCKRYDPGTDGCNQNDEAAIFALQEGDKWNIEIVKAGSKGSCGEFTSLAFDQSGAAHVAFRCTIEIPDGFSFRPYVASKALGEIK